MGVGAAILSRGAGSVGVDMLGWGRPSWVGGGGSERVWTSWVGAEAQGGGGHLGLGAGAAILGWGGRLREAVDILGWV